LARYVLAELIILRVEPEDQGVISDGPEIRDVRVGIELLTREEVVRRRELSFEESETLLSDDAAGRRKFAVEADRGDVPERIVLFEIPVLCVSSPPQNKNIAAVPGLVRRRVADHQPGLFVQPEK
jgi:hypothetical protein